MTAPADVLVVGGGSAGMTAAVAAARLGARVVVLERMNRVGKKLLVTGNGRCNLTNVRAAVSRYHGSNPSFAAPALEVFPVEATLDFFAALGIHPMEEECGKIFPRSGQASAVLDVLRMEMERLGVEVLTESPARGIERQGGGFTVRVGDDRSIEARAIILAAGGRAAPQLGSNGSGYALVASLGHPLVESFPALTKIRVASQHLKRLSGLKFDGRVTLTADGQTLADDAGEILFTDTGLSGPPVLQVSRVAAERSNRGLDTLAVLDVVPELGADDLASLLARRLMGLGDRPLELGLVGFLHKRLIPVILQEAGFDDPRRFSASLDAGEIARLAELLKKWPLSVTGVESWHDAQVTAGGVDTGRVDPATMESLLVPGLFFAGEVLDIDGDCGGFNLQWAWSSGYLAGTSAARFAGLAP